MSVHGLSCEYQWQCSSVTTNYNFVSCVDGTCQCRSDLGFEINQTTSKCDCLNDGDISWYHSQPYCVTVVRSNTLKALVIQLYSGFVDGSFPNISSYGPFQDLFASDVKMRIDPYGEWYGQAEVSHRLAGATALNAGSRMTNFDIEKLVIVGDVATVNVHLHLHVFPAPGNVSYIPSYDYNLTQTGSITFNSANKIVKMDLVNRNAALSIGNLFPNTEANLNRTCDIILAGANCTDAEDSYRYQTKDECVVALKAKPFGTWDNLRTDSVLCRLHYATLVFQLSPTQWRPHCVDIGENPARRCRDHTRNEYYGEFF